MVFNVQNKKLFFVVILACIASIAVFFRGPIPQDPRYHDFADQRTLLAIPNTLNVLSNVPFMIAGAWGMVSMLSIVRETKFASLITQYLLFFSGVFLSGIGSCWYHLAPSNASLVWDRLPMTIAFMSFLSSVISECIERRAGSILLVPFLLIGVFSVGYWTWTESAGNGDLRLYGLVQFLPVVFVPLIVLLYKPARDYAISVWMLSGMYVLAKLFELADREVFALTRLVSGHTIKHVVAAAGVAVIANMVRKRRQVPSNEAGWC